MEEERIDLSARERERLKVLHEVEQAHLRQVEAARSLRLSDRQLPRLLVRLRTAGDRGLMHVLRGRPPTARITSSGVLRGYLVDVAGIEPATPCLQSRCSPS